MPGKGRPFQTGNNANPNGQGGKDPAKAEARKIEREIERRCIEDVAAAARERTDKALNTPEAALDNPNCPWPSKITAAVALLDRGHGKARETIEATHRTTVEDLVLASMRVEEDRKAAGEVPN